LFVKPVLYYCMAEALHQNNFQYLVFASVAVNKV
jgi:hypothetical protein